MTDRLRKLDEGTFDVIVVGAGLGGLTAAALLARRGRKVLVADAHYVAGGNGTIFRRRGYEFDVGIHYIGDCEVNGGIPRILRAAGVEDVVYEEMDPDGYDTLVFPDFRFRIPRGIERFRERLVTQFPAEKRGIDRYVKLLRQIDALSRLPGRPLSALWTVPWAAMALRWVNRPFAEFLDTCTRDVRLRAVLAGQNGDYGQPPSRTPTVMAAGLTLHYLRGAYYPRGGGQVLADRLAESIERHGGKIVLRTWVRRIVIEDGRVTGVEIESKHLGRRVVRAPVVVSNADLKHTMRDLVGAPHVASETLRRTERYEMSPALGTLYLGVARDLVAEGHPRTNYWIYDGYEYEPAYEATARGEFLGSRAAYVSIASVKDPTNRRLAPRGVTNLQVMALAPAQPEAWGVSGAEFASGEYRRKPEYLAAKERYAAGLIEAAERVLPGLREQIVHREVSTPLTHRRYTNSTGGTSYGIALVPEQFMGRRPGARTEVAGLYLCGASCRSAHGVGGVTMSGLVAASSVLGGGLTREVLGPAGAVRPGDVEDRAAEPAAAAAAA